MSQLDCIHGISRNDCATCSADARTARSYQADRVGHEKLLIFCPTITDDSLLHFNRQGDSYRLRAYVGRLAGRREWTQPDAPTSAEFLRSYPPKFQINVAAEQLSVGQADRWAGVIATQNARLGINGDETSTRGGHVAVLGQEEDQ